MSADLFSEIEYLKGVGSARGEKYRKLGISSPYDLIYHIPRAYLDFRAYIPIMSTVAIVLAFWGIIVMYSYHKKYGLTNNRQTLELFLALALGILNFFV